MFSYSMFITLTVYTFLIHIYISYVYLSVFFYLYMHTLPDSIYHNVCADRVYSESLASEVLET